MTDEIWCPIERLNGLYSISNLGRIRSERRTITRTTGHKVTYQQKLLKLHTYPPKNPYPYVIVRGKHYKAHHLVAEAFIGPRPEGMWVLHRNDVKTDNRPENLYYGTPSQNNHDAVKHGLNPMTKRTHCPQGHEYTPENTRIYNTPQGWVARYCRTCGRAATARWAEETRRGKFKKQVAS